MNGSAGGMIVGIGGTTGGSSTTERALRIALTAVERHGLTVRLFDGDHLSRLPLFNPKSMERSAEERELLEAIRSCSGVILASPGYHGSISGVVKNALDLMEDTARDARPYLHDLPVGIIATAYGWQATGSTIAAMRAVVHALRGWPTPFAAAINGLETKIGDGNSTDGAALEQIERVAEQVVRAVSMNSNRGFTP